MGSLLEEEAAAAAGFKEISHHWRLDIPGVQGGGGMYFTWCRSMVTADLVQDARVCHAENFPSRKRKGFVV